LSQAERFNRIFETGWMSERTIDLFPPKEPWIVGDLRSDQFPAEEAEKRVAGCRGEAQAWVVIPGFEMKVEIFGDQI